MLHGEREVNCRGEGCGGEKKGSGEGGELRFLWADGYCATPKASKTNRVHLIPLPLPEDGAPPRRQNQPPWGTHILGGSGKTLSP